MTDQDARRIEDKVDALSVAVARLEGSLSPTLAALTNGQREIEESIKTRDLDVEARFATAEGRIAALERFRYSVPSVAFMSLAVSLAILAYYLVAGTH